MRFFNTSGPVVAADHYCIPPLERLDLDAVLMLIRQRKYFVLHAPRQTGKTSALLALRDLLNSGAEGDYRCVYVDIEGAQAVREDVEQATRVILGQLAVFARTTLGDEFLARSWSRIFDEFGPGALTEALTRWTESDPKPLVLLIDEVDALQGNSLLSMLRQLRAGYVLRPRNFPQSVILCGVRDVRDYRTRSPSASPFNIKAESLRLGDFSERDVRDLLGMHTEETGQAFTPEALDTVWARTCGQPWLVNALAYDTCFRNRAGRDRGRPITAADVLDAQEQLILRRETHLDHLADRLRDERVRRIVEPLLSGAGASAGTGNATARDLEYARDLGLVARDPPVRIANPIYGEVVPRELTWITQEELTQEAAWYVTESGSLDVGTLMASFQRFFREHSEHWRQRFEYQEAWPQLLLQAFLQRIVNGGGRIDREYGLGRGRTDLLITWPQGGAGDGAERYVIECKVRYGSLDRTIAEGVEQTAGYVGRCGAAAGHLVIFDRREDRSWEEKLFHRRESAGAVTVDVWGM